LAGWKGKRGHKARQKLKKREGECFGKRKKGDTLSVLAKGRKKRGFSRIKGQFGGNPIGQ